MKRSLNMSNEERDKAIADLAARVAAIEAELGKISGALTKPEVADVRNEENGQPG